MQKCYASSDMPKVIAVCGFRLKDKTSTTSFPGSWKRPWERGLSFNRCVTRSPEAYFDHSQSFESKRTICATTAWAYSRMNLLSLGLCFSCAILPKRFLIKPLINSIYFATQINIVFLTKFSYSHSGWQFDWCKVSLRRVSADQNPISRGACFLARRARGTQDDVMGYDLWEGHRDFNLANDYDMIL